VEDLTLGVRQGQVGSREGMDDNGIGHKSLLILTRFTVWSHPKSHR
jgi:hypothetical protein